MKIARCKICGGKPDGQYPITLSVNGCAAEAYCIECCLDEEDVFNVRFPFIDHSTYVYGKTEEQAKERWNDLNSYTISLVDL